MRGDFLRPRSFDCRCSELGERKNPAALSSSVGLSRVPSDWSLFMGNILVAVVEKHKLISLRALSHLDLNEAKINFVLLPDALWPESSDRSLFGFAGRELFLD